MIYQLQSDSYLSTFKDADLWSAFKMCKGVKSAPIKPKSGFFGHSGTFYTDSEDETSTVDEISTSKTNTTRRKNEKSNRKSLELEQMNKRYKVDENQNVVLETIESLASKQNDEISSKNCDNNLDFLDDEEEEEKTKKRTIALTRV